MSGTDASDRDAARGATESDERGEVEYLRRAHWEMTQEAAQAKAERDEMFSAALRLKRKHIESHARAESAEAALTSEREAHAGLRARVEAVLADRDHSDTCSDALSPDAGYPCTCFRADLRAALAAEPAAPVAAEEGGEQEAAPPPSECYCPDDHASWCPNLIPAPSGSDDTKCGE